MRSDLLARDLRALSKASAVFVLALAAASCSNDASRLDQFLTASTQVTGNQKSIINKTSAVKQAYPGDVSAQVAKRAAPLAVVAARSQVPSITRSQLPSATATKPLQTISTVAKTAAVAKQVAPAVPSVSGAGATAAAGALVLAPRKSVANPLRMVGTDRLTTGAISKVKPKQAVQAVQAVRAVQAAKAVQPAQVAKPQGWNNTTGARITVKPGETLYNLSRRFGVPVSAIMKANGLKDANTVTSGSRILIPAYNYSADAPISAPDNDPTTRASRASRGFQGQARGKITVPKRGQLARKAKVQKPVLPTSTSAGAQGAYNVTSGDSVYGIAKRHNVSAVALRQANGLTGNDLKIGQKLTIPPSGSRKVAANGNTIDPMTTGAIRKDDKKLSSKTTKYSVPGSTVAKKAPKKTNKVAKAQSGTFRWPAQGRVITKFGERDVNGTNDGIDIAMPVGTPVKATESGTVIYSGSELEDFGKLILVSHANGWVSAYAHASSALVRRGDKVKRGQVIAKSGRTGNATSPKLHFELRKDSNPVNPLKHLAR